MPDSITSELKEKGDVKQIDKAKKEFPEHKPKESKVPTKEVQKVIDNKVEEKTTEQLKPFNLRKTGEQMKLKPKEISDHHVQPQQETEECIPWNKQNIILKKTQKESRVPTHEAVEEVTLKPIKKSIDLDDTKKTEEIQKPKDEKIQYPKVNEFIDTELNKIQKAPISEEARTIDIEEKLWQEPTVVEDIKPEITSADKISEVEKISWRKPRNIEEVPTKIDEQINIQAAEEEINPSKKQSLKDQEVSTKAVPWTEELIKLKKTPKTQKVTPEEEKESVVLKPSKKEKVEKPDDIVEDTQKTKESEETDINNIIKKSKKIKKASEKQKSTEEEEEKAKKENIEKDLHIVEETLQSPQESVIVETITEVEDTVVLKLEDDKKAIKPKKNIHKIIEKPEEIKLKPVRKIEQAEENVENEKITLKSVGLKEQEAIEIENEKKKRKPKKEEIEIPEIKDFERYHPEQPDKIDFEKKDKLQETDEFVPWKKQEKIKPEQTEEEATKLKVGKGKISKEEEISETVKLKPTKKEKSEVHVIEEISTPKKQSENVTEHKDFQPLDSKIKFKPTPVDERIEEVFPEQITEVELHEKLPEEQLTVPWRRTPKQTLTETPEVKEWPRGKRKPLPEDEKEEIELKPHQKLKPASPELKYDIEEIKPQMPEEVVFKDQTDSLKFIPPEVDKNLRKTRKPKIKPNEQEVVEAQPVFKIEQEKDMFDADEKEIPWRKIEDEKPELKPTKVEASIDENKPKDIKISEKEIDLIEIKTAEEQIVSEHIAKDVTEAEEISRDIKVQIVSKKKKSEPKPIVKFGDTQPLPELEIISQKRTTEIVDKIPDEKLTEDIDVHEEQTVHKSIVEKTIGKRQKGKTVAPKFIQRVEPVVAEKDKPTRLICKVEGTPFPEITWYKNEKVFHANERVTISVVENTVTLEFAKVEPQDVAIYSCKATNSAGVATSTANLVILEKEEEGVAPHFIEPLKPQIVEEKSKAILQCKVEGQPTPNIKWFVGNEEIKPTKKRKTSFNPNTGFATLEILEPSPNDDAIYSVKAENKFGKAECRANIIVSKAITVTQPTVLMAPKFIKTVPAMVAKSMEEIVLDAEYEGIPNPEIQWFRNGQQIKPSETHKITSNDKKSVLKISKKIKQRGGKYEIRAKNEKGEIRSSGTVTVSDETTEAMPPKFTKPITPKYATEGEVTIFETAVEAFPAATFQWYINSVPVTTSEDVRVTTQENKSILLIKEVKPEHVGPITCRAENVVGSVTCTATLCSEEEVEWEKTEELHYPRFVKKPSPVRVMDGEKVSFSCVVVGKPTPKVEWYHNNQPVKEAKDVEIYQDSEGVCTLTISEVFPENAGEYTCVASNKLGEATCMSPLIVEAYEYVPDSEIGQLTASEEDLLMDKTISEGDILSDTEEIAPQIVKKLPKVIATKDGDVIKLEVKVKGKPKPKGKWLKHGEEIIPSQDFIIESLEDGTSILTISEVYPDDTGTITFEAHNPMGVTVTTTQLVVESTKGIVGTKHYRKPEWVTHMEELETALKAAQTIPTFVQEIKDIRTTEAESVVFECQFSGTPTPDVIWYHNDKIIRNTDKVKIRIEENKTTCSITEVDKDHVGTYVCKAVSDIGTAVTKAVLYVQEIPEAKKKEILIRKAQEREEKIKKERVTIEKKKIERRKQRGSITKEDDIKPLDVTEVTTLESTQEISEKPIKDAKAKPVLDIQEPVKTEAIATCKKIDDKRKEEKPMEQATELLSPQEPTISEKVVVQETTQLIEDFLPKEDKAKVDIQRAVSEIADITEIKLEQIIERVEKIITRGEIKMAKEVSQMLDFINVKEFGPGEQPLKEIAEIGYLLNNGITVKEITVLYDENKFPSLKSPDAQSAMVNVVERKGYGALISEVLTEETTVDESKLAATVGFRAFMKMVEANYVTIEEVITQFTPQDFIQRAWESTEASETTTKDFAEMVTIREEVEILEDHGIVEKKIQQKDDEDFPDGAQAPHFIKRFEEQTVPEKSPLKLVAKIIGYPEPEVIWLRNNEPIKPSDRINITFDGENAELTINESNSELDSGDYKCIAMNTYGRASCGSKVSVEVDYVKFVRKLKKTYDVFERDTIELECETSHSVRTKWFYNNTELSGMDHRAVVQDKRIHKLIIKNISKKDEGQYKCTVKNQKTETTVNVQQRKLEFVRRLQDIEITEKEEGILEVEITSDTADVIWQKEGLPIDEKSSKYRIEKQGGNRKLYIRSTSIHDEGEYSCILLDDECKAEVTVIELPPEIISPLQDQTVVKGEKSVFEIELSKGDALVKWYKDNKEIHFSEHVQLSIDGKRQKLKIYNTQPEDEGVYSIEIGKQRSSAKLTVEVPTLTFITPLPEFTVIGMKQDAEFLVELSREDAEVTWLKNGRKIESSSKYTIKKNKTFRKLVVHEATLEDEYEYSCTVEDLKTSSKLKVGDKPSPPRGPLEISGMSATSFTVQWQPSESDGGSPIIEYIIEIKDATSKKPFKKMGATKGDVTDFPVNYLEKDHGYKFRITARNAIGISDPYLPEDTIIAGSRITPPSPPLNLQVKETTSKSATITWEPPENDGGSEITGYVVEKKLEYVPKWEKVYTLESFNLSYTFENLKEKSDYVFRVFAENIVGLSAAATTEVVKLRTHATVPSPPTPPLEMRPIGPNALVVEWGVPEWDGGSPILGYNIAIRDTKKTMWMEIGRVQKGVLKFTIRDLQEDHEYMIRIFAKNEIGLSEPLESDEPYKVLSSGETDQEDFKETTDREPTSYSTETTISWLRDNNMDADIHSYAKGTLLRKDEYFFRIWCYAKKLFK